MKGLTSKEEEIMNYFWHKGPLFVKELLDFYIFEQDRMPYMLNQHILELLPELKR